MKIWKVNFEYEGLGLAAVVIAETPEEAVSLLKFDEHNKLDGSPELIGIAADGQSARVLAEEML